MMKHIGILLFIFCSLLVRSQGLNIKVKLNQAAGEQVFLANYYLGNIYAKDTIQLDNRGEGIFHADSIVPQGLYKIYLNQDNHFDFLLGADQQFSIRNETFNATEMKVDGSAETEAFVDYIIFLKNLQAKGAELREKVKSASEDEKKQLQIEMEGLTDRLHQKWEKIGEEHPDWFLAKFVKANHVPALDVSKLPEEVQNNDSLLLRKRFNFQREHFWDNFDYTDERFLYTPFYKSKLETWFTKVLYQDYDSVKPYVFEFIENVRPSKRIFQFVASWFLNSSINSNIMGMDALFVDLAREYYLSGEAFWATEETLEKIRENVLFAKDNLIGMTAPDLTLESFDGEYFTLSEIKAEYTIVLIYEPNCSHCKVFVPELYEKVYRKFRDKGLEVYAIYSMDDKEEWGEFLTKYGLFDWLNVWDEHHVSRFKILYDARKTPGVYVLDEDKTIVAKKMAVEQLEKFFGHELN
jgi:peroxiredoxin